MYIADVESRQASLRRMLKSVVQTHMLKKGYMMAHIVDRSLSRQQQGAGGREVVSVAAAGPLLASSAATFQLRTTRDSKR